MNDKKLFKAQTNVGDKLGKMPREDITAKINEDAQVFIDLFRFVGFNEGEIGAIMAYATFVGAASNGDLGAMDRVATEVRSALAAAKIGEKLCTN